MAFVFAYTFGLVQVRAAVEALKPLAEQHHRSKDTARIIIDVALPELCRSILQHPDELPATRVEHAMLSILIDLAVIFLRGL